MIDNILTAFRLAALTASVFLRLLLFLDEANDLNPAAPPGFLEVRDGLNIDQFLPRRGTGVLILLAGDE